MIVKGTSSPRTTKHLVKKEVPQPFKPSNSSLLSLPTELLELIIKSLLADNHDWTGAERRILRAVEPSNLNGKVIDTKSVLGCYHLANTLIALLSTCRRLRDVIYPFLYQNVDIDIAHCNKHVKHGLTSSNKGCYLLQKNDEVTFVNSGYQYLLNSNILQYISSLSLSTLNTTYRRKYCENRVPVYAHSLPEIFLMINKDWTPKLKYFRLRIHAKEISGVYVSDVLKNFEIASHWLNRRATLGRKVKVHLCAFPEFLSALDSPAFSNEFCRNIHYLDLLGDGEVTHPMPNLESLWVMNPHKGYKNHSSHNQIVANNHLVEQLKVLRLHKSVKCFHLQSKFSPEFVACSFLQFNDKVLGNIDLSAVTSLYLTKMEKHGEKTIYTQTHWENFQQLTTVNIPHLKNFGCERISILSQLGPVGFENLRTCVINEMDTINTFLYRNGSKVEKLHLGLDCRMDVQTCLESLPKFRSLQELNVFWVGSQSEIKQEKQRRSQLKVLENGISTLLNLEELIRPLKQITIPMFLNEIKVDQLIQLSSICSPNIYVRLALVEPVPPSMSTNQYRHLFFKNQSIKCNKRLHRLFSYRESFPLSPWETFRDTPVSESGCSFLGEEEPIIVDTLTVNMQGLKNFCNSRA